MNRLVSVLLAWVFLFAAVSAGEPGGRAWLSTSRKVACFAVINTYDKTGRLLTETIGLTATAYTYDKAANRTSKQATSVAHGLDEGAHAEVPHGTQDAFGKARDEVEGVIGEGVVGQVWL